MPFLCPGTSSPANCVCRGVSGNICLVPCHRSLLVHTAVPQPSGRFSKACDFRRQWFSSPPPHSTPPLPPTAGLMRKSLQDKRQHSFFSVWLHVMDCSPHWAEQGRSTVGFGINCVSPQLQRRVCFCIQLLWTITKRGVERALSRRLMVSFGTSGHAGRSQLLRLQSRLCSNAGQAHRARMSNDQSVSWIAARLNWEEVSSKYPIPGLDQHLLCSFFF